MSSNQPKRLKRSTRDRVLAGVLGGLGEYLGVDANILRIIAVILFIFSPTPILILYLAAVLLIPRADEEKPIIARLELEKHVPLLIGIILIIIGAGMLGGAAIASITLIFTPHGILPLIQAVIAIIILVIGLILALPHLRKL